jgi:hypothetical protein
VIDTLWADHLALVEDVREGDMGGIEPLRHFRREIVEAFDRLLASVDRETVTRFDRVRYVDNRLDFAGTSIRDTASTWTYLVGDDPFSSFTRSLLGNSGVAGGAGLVAALAMPLTLIISAGVLLHRRLRRKRTSD